MEWRRGRLAIVLGCTLLAAGIHAQPASRRPVTIEALRQYPGFYHLQSVLLRGELVQVGNRFALRTDDNELSVMAKQDVKLATGTVDLRATLLDVGRLEPGDPRVSGYRPADSERWPKPGEELVLEATGVLPSPPPGPPSMRALALDPARFEGQKLTLVGQFRGRNLFGDLPGAPRKSQYDFVIKSGDSAVWVVGLRPRGKGFDLDINARVDTSRWVEVTGVARRAGGLVTLEASSIVPASEPKLIADREDVTPPPPPPPVEVVFSSPTEGEFDVPPASQVRVQFGRNLRPETLQDRVKVEYSSNGGDPAPPIEWKTSYDGATRALTITFTKPLEPLRTVKVELLDGILAFDGGPFVPWTLTYIVGS